MLDVTCVTSAAGAGGGVAGIIAGQPLDVVRVRLQQKSPHKGSLSSMWRQIVRKEGMRSLFKGAAYPVTTIAMQVWAIATATLLLTCRFGIGSPISCCPRSPHQQL